MLRRHPVAPLILLSLVLSAGCGDSSHAPAQRDTSPPAVGPEMPPAGSSSAVDPHAGLFAAPPTAATEDLGPEASFGSIRLTAPAGWTRQPPRNQFVAAEFTLPKAEGDEADGRLTLSLAGGSIKENVERWRSQFGDKPEKDSEQELTIAGCQVTVVDFVGTFSDQPGPFAPAVERPGYRMLAAIVPIGEQLHFIKAYGPHKTMGDHEDAFHAFLQTLQRQ